MKAWNILERRPGSPAVSHQCGCRGMSQAAQELNQSSIRVSRVPVQYSAGKGTVAMPVCADCLSMVGAEASLGSGAGT